MMTTSSSYEEMSEFMDNSSFNTMESSESGSSSPIKFEADTISMRAVAKRLHALKNNQKLNKIHTRIHRI